MNRSEQINELASALAKAQAEMSGASKDAANPFYKSKYADLKSIIEATRPALTKNGLTVIQAPKFHDGAVEVETMIAHSSGQWVSETLRVLVSKQDAQGIGSAIAYGRRYGMGSFVGVYAEDDDGNGAVGKGNYQKAAKMAAKANGNDPGECPPNLDPRLPENTTPPWDETVTVWKDFVAGDPTVDAVNDECKGLYKLTETDQKVAWAIVANYVKKRGWTQDKKTKLFREPVAV